jgi:hypothetical protein
MSSDNSSANSSEWIGRAGVGVPRAHAYAREGGSAFLARQGHRALEKSWTIATKAKASAWRILANETLDPAGRPIPADSRPYSRAKPPRRRSTLCVRLRRCPEFLTRNSQGFGEPLDVVIQRDNVMPIEPPNHSANSDPASPYPSQCPPAPGPPKSFRGVSPPSRPARN